MAKKTKPDNENAMALYQACKTADYEDFQLVRAVDMTGAIIKFIEKYGIEPHSIEKYDHDFYYLD